MDFGWFTLVTVWLEYAFTGILSSVSVLPTFRQDHARLEQQRREEAVRRIEEAVGRPRRYVVRQEGQSDEHED